MDVGTFCSVLYVMNCIATVSSFRARLIWIYELCEHHLTMTEINKKHVTCMLKPPIVYHCAP